MAKKAKAMKRKKRGAGLTVGQRVDILAANVREMSSTVKMLSNAHLAIVSGDVSGGCPRCTRMSKEVDRLHQMNLRLIEQNRELIATALKRAKV